MSRVSYSMMNPGGAALMTAAVREALCGLALDVARQAGISHEDILEATLVGNPIMHHLLLGIDPVELGGAPFALATDHSLTLRANVIDLKLHRNARVYVLPCIAGHVGADAAGMVLAERPDLDARDDAAGGCGHERRNRAGQQPASGGLLQPDRTRVRRRADQLRSARGAGSDRTRAHRPRDPRAALQSHRLRSLVRRCGIRRRPPRPPASRACAARASSRSSRRCTSPASSIRTACSTGAWRRVRRASSRTAEHLLTCCIEVRCEMKITQTRRARDSAGEGGVVCRHRAADGAARRSITSIASVSPARSAATSTSSTR